MARYTLSTPAYLNDQYQSAGAAVDVADDLVPGPHMEPARDEKGREDKAARAAKDKAAGAALPAPGDPAYIGRMIAHTMADGSTNGPVSVSSSQATAPGVVVDAAGMVRGVAEVPEPPAANPAG